MKQKNLFFAGIILLLLIAIIILAIQFKGKGELSSFTINLYADFTSSGGSRYYNASLTFQEDELISGWQTYETWPGTEGHNIVECIIDANSLNWIDKNTKGECEYKPEYIPLNKNGILQKINSGEFKPVDKCEHLDICYEITK